MKIAARVPRAIYSERRESPLAREAAARTTSTIQRPGQDPRLGEANHLPEAAAEAVADHGIADAAGSDEAETRGGPVPVNAHDHVTAMKGAARLFDPGILAGFGEPGGFWEPRRRRLGRRLAGAPIS